MRSSVCLEDDGRGIESEDTTEGAWLEDTQEDLGTGKVAGAVP